MRSLMGWMCLVEKGALRGEALLGNLCVSGVLLDADPLAVQILGGGGGGSGAQEGINDEVAFVRGACDEFFDEVDGLL